MLNSTHVLLLICRIFCKEMLTFNGKSLQSQIQSKCQMYSKYSVAFHNLCVYMTHKYLFLLTWCHENTERLVRARLFINPSEVHISYFYEAEGLLSCSQDDEHGWLMPSRWLKLCFGCRLFWVQIWVRMAPIMLQRSTQQCGVTHTDTLQGMQTSNQPPTSQLLYSTTTLVFHVFVREHKHQKDLNTESVIQSHQNDDLITDPSTDVSLVAE